MSLIYFSKLNFLFTINKHVCVKGQVPKALAPFKIGAIFIFHALGSISLKTKLADIWHFLQPLILHISMILSRTIILTKADRAMVSMMIKVCIVALVLPPLCFLY